MICVDDASTSFLLVDQKEKQAVLDGDGLAVAGAAEGGGVPEAARTSGSPAAGLPHGATVRNYTPREGKVERT